MMTHAMAPPTGVRNVRAMEGRLMLTIEASSMIMNVPTAAKENVIHGLASSCQTLAPAAAPEPRARSARVTERSTNVEWSIFNRLESFHPGIRRDFDLPPPGLSRQRIGTVEVCV